LSSSTCVHFARPLIADPALRIHVCEASNLEQLHQAFLSELDLVQQSSEGEIATSLLVMPNTLQRFEDYLEFLGDAEAMLEELGLTMAPFSWPVFIPSICLTARTKTAPATSAIAHPIR